MISLPHLHLILNHFPVILLFLGTLWLLISMILKHRESLKSALIILAAAGIMSIPTYFSGEGAEDSLEDQSRNSLVHSHISHNYIEEHEDWAKIAAILSVLTAILSAVTLYFLFKEKTWPTLWSFVTFALALFALMAIVRTANLGGKVAHPELRDKRLIQGTLENDWKGRIYSEENDEEDHE